MQSAATAGTGYLDIDSDPQSVIINIDNKNIGATPLAGIELTEGTHIVFAKKEGYGSTSRTITINKDAVLNITIKLLPTKESTGKAEQEVNIEQDRGDLLVVNKIPRSIVYIDTFQKGSGSLSIKGISVGLHNLKVGKYTKIIQIHKDYLLKVEADNSGIKIMNDPEEIAKNIELERQEEMKRDAKRKEQEEQKRVEDEQKKEALKKIEEQKKEALQKINELISKESDPIRISGDPRVDKIKSGEVKGLKYQEELIKGNISRHNHDFDFNVYAEKSFCRYTNNVPQECLPLKLKLHIDSIRVVGLWGIGNKDQGSMTASIHIGDNFIIEKNYKASGGSPGSGGSFIVEHKWLKLSIKVLSRYGSGYEITIMRVDDYLPKR
jgi:hypothetical protein